MVPITDLLIALLSLKTVRLFDYSNILPVIHSANLL